MIAVRIRAQQAADVIGTAGRLFALPLHLSHVKRVRKEPGATELQVIICAANPHHASPPPAVTSSTPGTANCEDQNAHEDCQNQDDKPITGHIPSAVCPIGSLVIIVRSAVVASRYSVAWRHRCKTSCCPRICYIVLR